MKRIFAYILMLAIFASCQEKVDQPSAGEEPELTTVTLNLSAADLAGEPDSKANTPLIPDIENLIHDVWVIQFSERGVLYTGVDKFYRTSGEDGARFVTLEAQVMSGKSTICILANLNKVNTPTKTYFDVAALKAGLPDNLPQFKSTLLDMSELLHYINTNTKPAAIPMFGYWEGTIGSGSPEVGANNLNVTLGRMLCRVNLTLVNRSGSRLTRLKFTDAAVKTYYFPQISGAVLPDHAYCTKEAANTYTLNLANGNDATIYFYWTANFCYGPEKATKMTLTTESGTEYNCMITNSPLTDADPDYNMYYNCNYTVTVTLEP